MDTANVVDLQHRITLRNSTGALRTLWEIVKIHHTWTTKLTKRLLPRTLAVVIPALLVAIEFAVAGLFTSVVSNKAYGTVIAQIQPENCGF